jgi:trans-aconitate methyltransferase
MSVSETYYYKHETNLDTTNYRKHTSGNRLQRRLIDRFHARLTAIVKGLHPETILDVGCGEGFVAESFLRAMPAVSITGFDPYEPSPEARFRSPTSTRYHSTTMPSTWSAVSRCWSICTMLQLR